MKKGNTSEAPWVHQTFIAYLRSIEFPDWLVDIASSALADRREIDITVANRLSEAFSKYMGGDFTYASIARMITAQGYETVNNANLFIDTIINGRPTQITLTPCDIPSQEGRKRVIALGAWNVSVKKRVDYYPFFAAGMIRAIDPMFNGRPEVTY